MAPAAGVAGVAECVSSRAGYPRGTTAGVDDMDRDRAHECEDTGACAHAGDGSGREHESHSDTRDNAWGLDVLERELDLGAPEHAGTVGEDSESASSSEQGEGPRRQHRGQHPHKRSGLRPGRSLRQPHDQLGQELWRAEGIRDHDDISWDDDFPGHQDGAAEGDAAPDETPPGEQEAGASADAQEGATAHEPRSNAERSSEASGSEAVATTPERSGNVHRVRQGSTHGTLSQNERKRQRKARAARQRGE